MDVLVVSDWANDAAAVARAAGSWPAIAAADRVDLLVPAWLHGIDWAGDPRASAPCAREHARLLEARCAAAGVPVRHAEVGDPNPVTAVGDALAEHAYDAIVLATAPHRLHAPGPLRLERRLARAFGLPVRRLAGLPAAHRHAGHCAAAEARLAL